MKFESYREGSKVNWGVQLNGDQGLSMEQIQLGALLRIADATEKMAVGYNQLIRDLEYYKREHKKAREREAILSRSNAALKGQITKLKNAATPKSEGQ